ncbi:hypothetical protein [Nostoc sp.]|uniref:hypothetical protein n=1 Tax=Nostoc sp. TaxID=1180 RepID=UPI002FFB3590
MNHACELKVKVSLEAAFRDYLEKKSPTLNAFREGCRLKTCGRAAIEEHFQQEAGNEVLKGFHVKLTPMFMNCPYANKARPHIAVC